MSVSVFFVFYSVLFSDPLSYPMLTHSALSEHCGWKLHSDCFWTFVVPLVLFYFACHVTIVTTG